MTPLEKARAEEGRVNYCDECEQFEIVGNFAYCKVDGKLIHPIMMMRGQGTGPAWNCKKRIKPITNYDLLIQRSSEELAEFLEMIPHCGNPATYTADGFCVDDGLRTKRQWLSWLKQEVNDGRN